jgi:hypothetical protein
MNRQRVNMLSLVCACLFGCSELIVQGPDADKNMPDFNMLGYFVKTRYAFLQYKKINWDSLLAVYRPLAAAAKGDEIYPVLHHLLGELKDGHVEIRTEGDYAVITYDWPRHQMGKAYSPLVVRKYFDAELRRAGNDQMEYGITSSNVGYVYLASFAEGDWIRDFDRVLDDLKNTKGMIFDVRNNGGGNGLTGDFIVKRFLSDSLTYSSYQPDGSVRGTNTLNPDGPFQYHNPVIILINGASFSMAEIFPELMKQIPTVKTLGDTTGGGGGSNDVFLLPSSKRLRMPTSYLRRFNGDMIEWNGIPPDIVVPQTKQDIDAGRDPQLERAIRLF